MPLVVIIKKQYNINSSKMKKNLMTYAAGRLVLTVSFCCAMTTVVNAQNAMEDALKQVEQKTKLADKNPKNGKMQYQAAIACIADVLGEKKDFDRAISYANRALKIAQEHPVPQDTLKGLSSNALGLIYMAKQDFANCDKYMLMADAMISDTSSTIYEFLLLDKPVITLRAAAKEIYWRDMAQPEELVEAYDEVIQGDGMAQLRRWVIENYDPYLDGQVGHRMLEGARDYIRRHGVPTHRKLNIWRKYTSIKTFGRVRRD